MERNHTVAVSHDVQIIVGNPQLSALVYAAYLARRIFFSSMRSGGPDRSSQSPVLK